MNFVFEKWMQLLETKARGTSLCIYDVIYSSIPIMFFSGVTLFEFFSNGRYYWIALPKCIRYSILPFDILVAFLYIA